MIQSPNIIKKPPRSDFWATFMISYSFLEGDPGRRRAYNVHDLKWGVTGIHQKFSIPNLSFLENSIVHLA